jgi:hypothetical protein
MDISTEIQKLEAIQEIQQKVIQFCETKRQNFLPSLRESLEKQFPGLSTKEQDSILSKYANVGKFHNDLGYKCKFEDEQMPKLYVELNKQRNSGQRQNRNDQTFLYNCDEALKIPRSSGTAPFLPEKNTLLALQVINRLAKDYQVRFEDIETVLKEVIG